jgi:sugar phosphate isomerase/epimerase
VLDGTEPRGHAIDLLGHRIIGAHAKDIAAAGSAAAGREQLDYHLVFRLLARVPAVPVIVQDVEGSDAARVHDELVRVAVEVDSQAT